jgi:peptidyl-prolyl cis-trans isomerase A (cyclophilin A)
VGFRAELPPERFSIVTNCPSHQLKTPGRKNGKNRNFQGDEMKKGLIMALLFAAGAAWAEDKPAAEKTETKAKKEDKKSAETSSKGKKKMFAVMETSKGSFKIELYPDKAPKTVDNFVSLAKGTKEWTDPKSGKKEKKPLYNGTVFHRVIKKFMIQGGDPLGNGTGGPGYEFADEFSDLKHDSPGILSMANAGPGTNGSQFFVTVEPTPWLDGKHTIFGHVIEGMDIVKNISEAKTGPGDKPVEPIVLKSVKIQEK